MFPSSTPSVQQAYFVTYDNVEAKLAACLYSDQRCLCRYLFERSLKTNLPSSAMRPRPRRALSVPVGTTNANLQKRQTDECPLSSGSRLFTSTSTLLIVPRQVQDLQSQLADSRQENSHLRAKLANRDSAEIDRGPPSRRRDSQALSPITPQKARPILMKNFDVVRRNIQTYSSDIFDMAIQCLPSTPLTDMASAPPNMPPRADYANYSRSYLDSIHQLFPILHWPTFQAEVDEVYTTGSFQGMSREWIGLFFAVMACGTLQTSFVQTGSPNFQDRGTLYFETATRLFDNTLQKTTITHAKLALLLSIFATESNLKAAGGVWLGSAVRLAQWLRIYSDEVVPVVESEMRRRLWWSIYICDR